MDARAAKRQRRNQPGAGVKPTRREDRHINRRHNLRQRGFGGRGDQVHTERRIRARPRRRDFPNDQFRAFAHHSKAAKAARTRHCRSQLGSCDAAHSGLQDRLPASEEVASWSPKVESVRHVESPILFIRYARNAAALFND